MLLIGPGLLVNAGLKSLWGRPRPLQCEEFGGPMSFKPVGEIATQKFPNSSFPSGHAATAFFFIAPAFLVRRNNGRRRRGWFLAGIGYGSAMGFTRVLQGGHFVSDVLWAGIIVYFVGVGLSRILLSQECDDLETDSSRAQGTISTASTS
jgi:lipid A 4'-phosphatase